MVSRRARAAALLASLAVAGWALPWVVYLGLLSRVEPRPVAPAEPATPAQVRIVEQYFRGTVPATDRSSPPGYLLRLADASRAGEGLELAWLVARAHNAEHLVDRRMVAWHWSGAALTIWLSRNWTRAELIAGAHEIIAAESGSTPPRQRGEAEALKPSESGPGLQPGQPPPSLSATPLQGTATDHAPVPPLSKPSAKNGPDTAQ